MILKEKECDDLFPIVKQTRPRLTQIEISKIDEKII